MNISPNYQLKPFNFNSRANEQQIQTNPNFKAMPKPLKTLSATASLVLATMGCGISKNGNEIGAKEYSTEYGQIIYVPATSGKKAQLIVIRKNGFKADKFDNISKETLKSPVMDHVRQVQCSTINPQVGVELIQNQSVPVTARKVIINGTLENSLVKNNLTNIPVEFSEADGLMYVKTPWNPGIQYITGECLMVKYNNTVKEEWGALKDYIDEFSDPETGEAPDVAILAAQNGTEDRSFMPANIAIKQYEIVTESGERIPCNYADMEAGKDYKISKKAGVILKMAVPSEDVISSEGELLKAGTLLMVDSEGHFYNGQPIKRIKSGEVTWNADMNDPVQAQIRNYIDESLRLEAEAKIAKKAGNEESATQLSKQAKEFHAKAEQAMTEWVKLAQNPESVDFLQNN